MGMRVFLCLLLMIAAFPALAEDIPDAYRTTGYPLPRFAALASEKVFVRAGPGMKYPILWVYERAGYPVEITLEFEHWRKIRGHDGEEGWVHSSLLSGKRAAFVVGEKDVPIYRAAETDSTVSALLKPGVIADIERCEGAFCRLKASGYRGWAERKSIWGVYPDENLN